MSVPSSNPPAAPRVALFLKFDTLGDFVLFAPALRLLRVAWPGTRLCVVLRRAYVDLAPLLAPGVEYLPTSLEPFGTAPDPASEELARLQSLVTALAPDLVVAATSRRNWLEVALAAGAARPDTNVRRVALAADTADEHFSTQLRVAFQLDAAAVFPTAVAVPADEPDARRNLRLVAALLGRPAASATDLTAPPPPALPEATARTARETLTSLGLTPRRFVVCAAAGFANVRLKTWPAERYAAAIRHLATAHGLPVLLVGHHTERAYVEAVAAATGDLPAATAPRVWLGADHALPHLAALIAEAQLYLGNDTGAMHLAAALDVPVLAVFGGGTWPRFVPAARRGLAVVQPLPCFGCGWDCAFSETAAPCLTQISAEALITALDRYLAAPDAPFAVQALTLPAGEAAALPLMAAASSRYRALRAEHLARQHKLEELTALDREKDVAIAEKEASIFSKETEIAAKEAEIDSKEAEIHSKDAEITALKQVCDERERAIFTLDANVRDLSARLTAAQDDKARFQHALAQLPPDTAKAAETLANQSIHIRNIEALVFLRDQEIASLRAKIAELERSVAAYAGPFAASHAALAQAQHYGRLLAEKEAVLQTLNRACAEREAVITRLAAESTESTSLLHRLGLATAAFVREKLWRPCDAWLFTRVVEKYWMQIGILRHHDPRPLVWDRLPAPAAAPAAWPQIAIVTPSYGQEKFIERTLRSILDQNYPRLRYVVQDGGSKDRSPEIIAAHAARLHHWESARDAGQADAVRRGFAHVAGDLGPDDLMAWLNSDDLIGPGVLAFVGAYFAAHPEIDVIYGHRIIIDDDDRDVGRWIMPRHDPHVLEWIDYVPQETMFWRKRAWDLVGGIDPSFQFALDWDLLARFQQAGCRFARVPYFLGAFRVHAEQKTSQTIHTVGAEEMKRIRTRFHGERQDDWATIDRYARKTRFRGALVARLLALGIRW